MAVISVELGVIYRGLFSKLYEIISPTCLFFIFVGIPDDSDYLEYLVYLKGKTLEAVRLHSGDKKLGSLLKSIEEATLRMAVNK